MIPERHLHQLRLRFLTNGGNARGVAVTATATTVAVTFATPEPDTSYGVVATANWGTTVFVTNKATTGFTINFGTAAPANATVDYIVFRSA